MEEDIKILEDFIKYFEAEAVSTKYRRNISITVGEDDIEAIEKLIKGYRELESELKRVNNTISSNIVREINAIHKSEIKSKEDLQALYDGFQIEIKKDFIPKSKIKEKIEEKQKRIEKLHPASDCVIIDDLENQIQVLQELMEDK